MTSHDISNVLASIGEAKRALDAEPGYLHRIRELEQKLVIDGQTIAHREQRIHELKQSEEALQAKLRSVEAERDDAGFRALEEADKVQALSTLLHGFIGDAVRALAVVEGKAAPVVLTAQEYEAGRLVESDLTRQMQTLLYDLDLARNERDEAVAVAKKMETDINAFMDTPPKAPESPFVSSTEPQSGTALGSGQSGTDGGSTNAPRQDDASASRDPSPVSDSGPPQHGVEEEAGKAEDPFASKADTPPQPVSSSGVDSTKDAASTGSDSADDWWPIPSRASHHSS